MKSYCQYLLYGIACLILSIVPTELAMAETYVVTRTEDVVSGTCSPTACSLRDAILAANARPGHDTITVPAGDFKLSLVGRDEEEGQTGDLDISDSMTIEGEGPELTIIDGLGEDRVFEIQPNVAVSIKGLTITGGNTRGGGGGIASNSGSTTLENVIVRDNVAEFSGGGILSGRGSSLSIRRSAIKNNKSINNSGGGVSCFNAACYGVDIEISGNESGVHGGGLNLEYRWPDNTPRADFQRFIIAHNKTGDGPTWGGGLYVNTHDSGIGTIRLTQGAIVNNIGGNSGGGVAFVTNGSSLEMNDTTISGNRSGSGAAMSVHLVDEVQIPSIKITGVTIADNVSPHGSPIYAEHRGGGGGLPMLYPFIWSVNFSIIGKNIINSDQPNCRFDRSTNPVSVTRPDNVVIDLYQSCKIDESRDIDPLLHPLRDNHGSNGPTHALEAGSRARDASDYCWSDQDQRGMPRPMPATPGSGFVKCDIGAYEAGVIPPPWLRNQADLIAPDCSPPRLLPDPLGAPQINLCPGLGGEVFEFFHPYTKLRYPNCIADGPGCFEVLMLDWTGKKGVPFELVIETTPGLTFTPDGSKVVDRQVKDFKVDLLNHAGKRLAKLEQLDSKNPAVRFVAPDLPDGTYYLAIEGDPTRYRMSFPTLKTLKKDRPQ